MPEISEVEKLRLQLEPAWTGRRIIKWKAPSSSYNPKKYPQHEWSFFREKTSTEIIRLERLGKALCAFFGTHYWHMHFNSTGWWMPGNEPAAKATKVDEIYENFLHKVNSKSIRLKMFFDDEQEWHYHDGRTFGKWWIREGSSLRSIPYFASYGPDWFTETERAKKVISVLQSKKLFKDVLCDQKITAGIGNYMACEIAFQSKIHPHKPWNELTNLQKQELAETCYQMSLTCLDSSDHEHWEVFGKAGKPCPRHPDKEILYVKDKGDMRGSYYCEVCQPL